MNHPIDLHTIATKAKNAKSALANASTETKNRVLQAIIDNLTDNEETILEANQRDITLGNASGLSEHILDRLSLKAHFENLLNDIYTVMNLNDPVGQFFDPKILPNGFKMAKMRTPIGVIGMIYESLPNVTVEASMLLIKSGNCAILHGGSESLNTNRALMAPIHAALLSEGLPAEAIQLIESTDRAHLEQLLRLNNYIDLIIPRGNHALQQFCQTNSTIPVIAEGIGICHIYVDSSAKIGPSLEVITNAKMRQPMTCNALSTLLVHESIAKAFIPQVITKLQALGVELKLDENAWKSIDPSIQSLCHKAGLNDWDKEWLSLTLGIKIVENVDEAIAHIQRHSTNHSDGILTENFEISTYFTKLVDSAAVYVNTPTCFTDGSQLGLGGEVGISTQKLHARGPVSLTELTSYKWIIYGNYQTRS